MSKNVKRTVERLLLLKLVYLMDDDCSHVFMFYFINSSEFLCNDHSAAGGGDVVSANSKDIELEQRLNQLKKDRAGYT